MLFLGGLLFSGKKQWGVVDLGVGYQREREKGRCKGRSCCWDVLYERRIHKNKINKGHTESECPGYFVSMISQCAGDSGQIFGL